MNGYGPQNNPFLSYFLNKLAKWIGFKESNANKHDVSYLIGGSEKDRIRADTGFLRYLLVDSEEIIHKVLLAYLFYFSVRIFGRKHFNYITK